MKAIGNCENLPKKLRKSHKSGIVTSFGYVVFFIWQVNTGFPFLDYAL